MGPGVPALRGVTGVILTAPPARVEQNSTRVMRQERPADADASRVRWWSGAGARTTSVVAVLVVHALLPDGAGRDALYVTVGVAAAVVATRAARRMSGPARRAWLLLSAGLAAWVAGDVIWTVLDRVLGLDPFPSLADVPYLASYPLLAAGLLRAFPAPRDHRREWFLDTVLMTGGVLLVLWQLLLAPTVLEWASDPGGSVVGALYPAGDALLLIALARPFLARHRQTRAYVLTSASVLAILAADVLFQLGSTHGVDDPLYLLDSLWLLGYVLVARAARAHATDLISTPQASGELTGRHMALFSAAAATVPVTLVVSALGAGAVPLLEVCVVGSVMMSALLLRFWWLVREQRATNVRLEHLAMTDPLTGLANAVALAEHVGRDADQAEPGTLPAVLLIALDGYRDVVETLGHAVADDLLRAVGTELADDVVPGGLPARLSREVFALAVEVRDPQEAADAARAVLARLGTALDVHGMDLLPGALVGVAVAPARPAALDDLVARADTAVSSARRGPERFAVDCPGTRDGGGTVPAGGALLRGLVAGAARGELVVHFQPVTTVLGGAVTGAEALVRWQHPVHGLLGPAAFVPAAERTGLVRTVTLVVLDVALEECARLRALVPDFTVAVNVSAHDVDDARLVGDVRAALERHALPPSALTLEVTETMAMRDVPRAEQTLRALADLGVLLAVDDYGVGYGSLDYLRRLPFTVLKVDRAFVAPAATDPVCAAILRSTIDLGHALGMQVVAEGVEDDDTAALLGDLGCDLAQGWALGRPGPAHVLEQRVERQLLVG